MDHAHDLKNKKLQAEDNVFARYNTVILNTLI